MDYDRLRELVDLSDRTWNLIDETYELRKAVPCPMGTGDAMNTMVPINFMMATQDSYNFFLNLNKELKDKIAKREGEVDNEKYRLLWGGGLPAWFALSDFNYFNSKGACFPAETTYRMVAPLYEMDIPETKDPIEHLAWRWLGILDLLVRQSAKAARLGTGCGTADQPHRELQDRRGRHARGLLLQDLACGPDLAAPSTRKNLQAHPGLRGHERQKRKDLPELPSLILESDIIDITSYSEVDTRNKIDAFIETLESIRKNRAD